MKPYQKIANHTAPPAPGPPSELWAWGDSSLLARCPDYGLSIVGGREPQSRHLEFCANLLSNLSDPRIVTLSGLARGVDTAVHVESLRNGIPTIAIVGSGFDRFYPQENFGLARAIFDAGGLLISEYSPETPAKRYHFPKRNRLLAAWAKAVLIVQSSKKSGSLHTANWAIKMEKDLFAVPHFPGERVAAGNQSLLDEDHAHPCWGVDSLKISWLDLETKSNHLSQGNLFPRTLESTPSLMSKNR